MRKAISVTATLLIMLILSCKKENTVLNTWTFKNVSYNADSAAYNPVGGGAVFANATGSELIVYFTNGLPSTSTTYTVASGDSVLPVSHVYIGLLTTAADYHSTGGNGSNQTVTVNVASGGKISISGNNIEVINTTQPSDSSSVGFNFSLTK